MNGLDGSLALKLLACFDSDGSLHTLRTGVGKVDESLPSVSQLWGWRCCHWKAGWNSWDFPSICPETNRCWLLWCGAGIMGSASPWRKKNTASPRRPRSRSNFETKLPAWVRELIQMAVRLRLCCRLVRSWYYQYAIRQQRICNKLILSDITIYNMQ